MILAIDTSTQWMGISLFDGCQVLYEKVWKTNRRHTVELSPAIATALLDTGTDRKDLKSVAVALGPGSFTSLRIGLAAAKGLSLSLHIPLIGIQSMDIIANGIPVQKINLICLLRAGRGRFAAMRYSCVEEKWVPTGKLFVISAHELEKSITSRTLVCGEMDCDEKNILARRWRNIQIAAPPKNIRRPSILANMAYKRFIIDDFDDAASTAPIYLHTVRNIDSTNPV
ncbi:MAG: tRNA (adenosine(37)-N6)-threonylcarbamoyltransferase complex dimerization subunit type 1 TsaB [Anaerolineaceae bacterium]|nr:tRNA (adenosine(37)-N6)-threonylcarbamoyltransferase complex dimerization subunit type 1 TsaB [Anaerolineaceae bacterium]